MSIKSILQPKSPKEIRDEFCKTHKIHDYVLRDFLKVIQIDKRILIWFVSTFIMVFGLTMIINGLMALDQGYFWFPINPEIKSMLSFINIFWAITWFAMSILIIAYGIVVLVRAYTKNY